MKPGGVRDRKPGTHCFPCGSVAGGSGRGRRAAGGDREERRRAEGGRRGGRQRTGVRRRGREPGGFHRPVPGPYSRRLLRRTGSHAVRDLGVRGSEERRCVRHRKRKASGSTSGNAGVSGSRRGRPAVPPAIGSAPDSPVVAGGSAGSRTAAPTGPARFAAPYAASRNRERRQRCPLRRSGAGGGGSSGKAHPVTGRSGNERGRRPPGEEVERQEPGMRDGRERRGSGTRVPTGGVDRRRIRMIGFFP